jgi:hypothetical protein
MHEFELGVWKAIFKCLIAILNAAAPGMRLVSEFDARWASRLSIDCFFFM